MSEQLLKEIAHEIKDLKNRLLRIEQNLDELSDDLHEVRPEYLEKLRSIDKGKFLTREEFERAIED